MASGLEKLLVSLTWIPPWIDTAHFLVVTNLVSEDLILVSVRKVSVILILVSVRMVFVILILVLTMWVFVVLKI